MGIMKIDCLCITTSRRKIFKNWVLWNYLKQGHHNKELIVVSDDTDWPDWVNVVEVNANENIPTKRNIALATASGDAITWFDDDDWQNSQKLQIISENIDPMINVGCSRSFFFDIFTNKIARVDLGCLPIFNSIGVMRYGLPAFNERTERASDTDWLKKLEYRGNFLTNTLLSFWISHKDNISNPINIIKANQKLDYYLDGESWQQLTKLKAHLLQS